MPEQVIEDGIAKLFWIRDLTVSLVPLQLDSTATSTLVTLLWKT